MFDFEIKGFPKVSMLKSSTEEVFSILSKSIQKQGIILAEDIASYLTHLEQAIEEDNKYPQEIEKIGENGHTFIETRITLKQKLFPLKELMQHAIKTNQSIVYMENL